ncbi:DUF6397 family protein [Streptomyces sp. NPDC045431]|uniref:DUF6397 family protein n=1 Tax=Streptomyces sp. NPDC045431 TaxID=3155613 RepID=UPI0033F7F52B
MTATETTARTVALGRAAQELSLKPSEFDLAVQLGLVRTVPGIGTGTSTGTGGGRRRVAQTEIDRLRGAPDFPDGLRERVRTVGTAEAAELASITADRFTKLARTGHFTPVRFYLNRYRAIVWLYLAGEVREFAAHHPELLTGRLPHALRTKLDAGDDARPRNWRARRLGLLLRRAEDPWAAAAAIATLLDPVQLAEVVDDPYERAYLDRLRPAPPYGRPESVSAREIGDRLLLADEPDEILWHRLNLALTLDEARAVRQAPRPDGGVTPAPDPVRTSTTPVTGAASAFPPARSASGRSGLLARLRLRRRKAVPEVHGGPTGPGRSSGRRAATGAEAPAFGGE